MAEFHLSRYLALGVALICSGLAQGTAHAESFEYPSPAQVNTLQHKLEHIFRNLLSDRQIDLSFPELDDVATKFCSQNSSPQCEEKLRRTIALESAGQITKLVVSSGLETALKLAARVHDLEFPSQNNNYEFVRTYYEREHHKSIDKIVILRSKLTLAEMINTNQRALARFLISDPSFVFQGVATIDVGQLGLNSGTKSLEISFRVSRLRALKLQINALVFKGLYLVEVPLDYSPNTLSERAILIHEFRHALDYASGLDALFSETKAASDLKKLEEAYHSVVKTNAYSLFINQLVANLAQANPHQQRGSDASIRNYYQDLIESDVKNEFMLELRGQERAYFREVERRAYTEMARYLRTNTNLTPEQRLSKLIRIGCFVRADRLLCFSDPDQTDKIPSLRPVESLEFMESVMRNEEALSGP